MLRRRVVPFVLLSVLFVLMCAQTAMAAPSASFGGPSLMGTGYYVYSQTTGDLNNDGHPDLVVPMYNSGSDGFLRTYLGTGAGGFVPSTVATIAGSEAQLADLDRDGSLDAVSMTMWSGSGHSLTFTKGDGAGGMTFAGAYDSGWMTTYYDIGDFNGDTIPDLLIGTGEMDNAYVFTGDGDFTFTQSSVVTGIGYNSWTSDIGDINRDGNQDFVVANYGSANLDIRLGDGTGVGFLALPDLPVDSNPTNVRLADLDRDGILDLVVGYNGANYVSVFTGDGFGDFTDRRDVTAAAVAINDFQIADMNVDGTLDIVVGGTQFGGASWSESQMRVLLNDGAGRFPVQVTPPTSQYWAYGLGALSIADLNGDARPDFVTSNVNSNAANNIGVHMNTSTIDHTLDPRAREVSTGTLYSPYRLATGDLDRDGKLDLVASSFNGGNIVPMLGDGLGGMSPGGAYGGLDSQLYGLAVADMDRDAVPDVVTFDNVGMSLFTGDGAGALSLQSQEPTAGLPTGAVIDANRDGNEDALMAPWSASSAQLLTGAGDGTFANGATFDLGTSNNAVVVADFNGDGTEDAVTVPGSDGCAHLALGDGNGGFTTSVSGMVSVYAPNAIAVGDLNGDNRPDLAVSSFSGVQIVINDGTGPSIAGQWLAGSGRGVAIGDFDVDGSLDVASCGDDGIVRYFDNDGAGTFTPATSVNVGVRLYGAAAGDFDRDGRPDVACAGESNKVYILTNDTAAPYTTPVFSFLPNGNLGWYVTTPTVTLETNEPATTDISFNGAAWEAYSGSVTPVVQGTNTLSFYSADSLGHKEATQTTTFKLDSVAPSTSIAGLPAGPASDDVTFTLSATDGGSGVNATYYRIGSGAQELYSTTATITASGANELSWWSVDNAGNVETAHTATVTIVRPEPPVTTSDSYSTDEDVELDVAGPGVLANDTDPMSGEMTVTVGTDAANGTLTLNADGSFTYMPDADWNGEDTFTYIAHNAATESAPETVTITVAAVADAPTSVSLSNDSVEENMPVGTGIGALTATDVDSSAFTYELVSGDTSAFSISGDELLTAEEFDYETKSTYALTIRVTDESDNTFDQIFTIYVTDVNEPPVAVDDSYETTTGVTLDVAAPGILGNDSDPEGDEFLALLGNGPAHGGLSVNADGGFSYSPQAGYAGTDSFTYRAYDLDLNAFSQYATVTITVISPDSEAPVTTSDAQDEYAGEALITLSATDDGSGVAATHWILDDGAEQTGTEVKVVTTGAHTLEFWSEDTIGNVEIPNTVEFTVTSDIIPIEGDDRYGTAIRTSEVAFPGGADDAVICRGDLWADVSGGSALAGAVDGPLLLTEPDAVADGLLDELERLEVGHVYILGSENAISTDVEDALIAVLGADGVTRIGGANRYETAAAVAEETASLLVDQDRFDGEVLVATGGSFPDAIAAGPLAARLYRPIILTQTDSLSVEASEALEAIGATDVMILGGEGAVSAQVADELADVPGIASVGRLSGADRYLTSIAIAEYGVSQGLEWNGVAVGAGTNFPDALAGGVMQGRFNSVVLLTRPNALPAPVADVLHAHRDEIGFCRILGGTSAVSEAVRVQIHNALQ